MFCWFAEDSQIFRKNQFSEAFELISGKVGDDATSHFKRLFTTLNTASDSRGDKMPDYLNQFPYVNGGLFVEDTPIPHFNSKALKLILQCSKDLNWSEINPDIFGSMIQAVAAPNKRSSLGMHYTSTTNIMKVIEPLFLNEFYDELDKKQDSKKQLMQLQKRLSQVKVFDPACGSGNFLTVAYKQLRLLEIEVLHKLQELEQEASEKLTEVQSLISLDNFYGIEVDEFAHEVALLSLWLVEYQMNTILTGEFNCEIDFLPLKKAACIVHGNACQLEWMDVCSNEGEVYLIGNPPYIGARKPSGNNPADTDSGTQSHKLSKFEVFLG